MQVKRRCNGMKRFIYIMAIILSSNAIAVKSGLSQERAEYVETRNCTCGKRRLPRGRIVGGRVAGLHEFPMMAALIDGVRARLYCGATIISEEYALTAAHCVPNAPPGTVALLAGDHDISTNKDTKMAQLVLVDRFVVHPEYSDKSQHHDIAVVKLRHKLEFGTAIWPACLPFRYRDFDFAGEKVFVTGWGSVEFLGSGSNKLLKVNLNILSVSECLQKLDNITPQQICTFAPVHDSCQDDSGGPLLWLEENKRSTLVGIISYGVGCATDVPAVNTRVTAYLDWILDNTPGAKYCSVAT